MKKHAIAISFLLVASSLIAQKVDRIIAQMDVARIIQTLASDSLNGRSALRPHDIDRAAAFISSEFGTIGLQYLPGLTSYRQEFVEKRIRPTSVALDINGKDLSANDVVLIAEKTSIDVRGGLSIRAIRYDSLQANPSQYFFDQAFAILGDTTSVLVSVDERFRANIAEFRSYFRERFARNRSYTKVFFLGPQNVHSYRVTGTQQVEEIRMANVVGVVPGKSRKEEMVVFSGHYDHIGILAPNAEQDSIANGADDDASGTTAVIELARYFQRAHNNERTLIFVAFTGEEIGGFGSRYFSRQVDADRVVAMFNIEMIGKPSKWGPKHAFITGFERSDFGEILQRNLKKTPFEFHPDPYPEQDLFYRSDNATLARLGVPAHTISTDQIDIDQLYHSVNDEAESLDLVHLTETIRSIAWSARTIISGNDTPKRIDKSQVR